MRRGFGFFLRLVASAIATSAIFVIGPALWHPDGNTDAIYSQAETLSGYVNSFSDENWREVVPKVQDATRDLSDGIYRLRGRLGEDRPWNDKPSLWLICFVGLIYFSYQTTGTKSSDKSYRLSRNGLESGPFTLEQLRSMWDGGMLSADTSYSRTGQANWSPLKGLFDSISDSASSNENPNAPALTHSPSPFAPNQITDPFGLSATTPLPATSITASKYYLRWLATPDRMRVHSKRAGGFGGTEPGETVDVYDIFDYSGLFICKIFINPYAKEDTTRAPEGLIYFRPSIEMFDARTQKKMRDAYNANFQADLKREKQGRAAMQKALKGILGSR